jgi:hypothetical protein
MHSSISLPSAVHHDHGPILGDNLIDRYAVPFHGGFVEHNNVHDETSTVRKLQAVHQLETFRSASGRSMQSGDAFSTAGDRCVD